jgi:hypothetical protein
MSRFLLETRLLIGVRLLEMRGTLVPNVQLVNLIAQVAGFVVLFAAPVLIPIERLPLPLQVLGWLMPPMRYGGSWRGCITRGCSLI